MHFGRSRLLFGASAFLITWTSGCAGSGSGGAGGRGASGGTAGATGGVSATGGSNGGMNGGTTGTGGAATGGSGSGGSGTGGAAGSSGAGTGGGTGGASLGAGGSAGSGGGSAGSAGSGAAGAAGACPYKLCEGFESGIVGGVPTGWTLLKGYGAGAAQDVGLAADQAHTGTMSLKSESMATGQNRVQKALASLGAVATKHWGRIFYKVQSPAPAPTPNNYLHVTFVALEGTTEDRVVDTVEQSDGTHQWLYNIPDDSCCTGSPYSWSFDGAWHCAEWYVDESSESYRFFSDGTEVTPIAFTNNAAAKMSAWTDLAVGEIFYQQPSSPFVVWFDDLAINDTQIGCQ